MHISCSNETPLIAFFGPTAINNWGPLDKRIVGVNYKKSGGIQRHGMHTVISSLKNCVPCSNSGCDNTGISDCLRDIDLKLTCKEINNSLRRKL